MPHVRCSRERCKQRRTLKRHPHQYIIVPRCKGCGGTAYRIDTYRRDVERQVKPCTCSQYHFPHRRGAGLCIHNPNVTEEYERERGRLPEEIPRIAAECPF